VREQDLTTLRVEAGPRWVFDLWQQGEYRCRATTSEGGRCRLLVEAHSGVSRYCPYHRDADEPVYAVQVQHSVEPCPCGCGFGVWTEILEARLVAGRVRREQRRWRFAPSPGVPATETAVLARPG
jgi:hypothetical protein